MRKSLSNSTGCSSALHDRKGQPVVLTKERDPVWHQKWTQDQYDHYYKMAWNVAYLIVGYPHEADLVADKAIDALWKYEKPLSKAEIETYLRVLARSRALDCLASPMHRLREKYKSLVQKQNDEEYETLPESPSSIGAEEEFFYEEERKLFAQEFAQALSCLSDLQRACFVLRFVEHIKPEEIAQMLRIPVNTVYAHTYRARNRVAKLLKDRRKK